ncbi:reverse transcriptase domain-containing protein [Tanacetum coccineum]
MWESAKTVAPTPNSAIVQLDVDDNFVINSTHLNMILENKFDGYLWADPHDHIREFLAICNMFKYGETQSEAVKLLIFPYSLSDKAKTWFNELNEESITTWEQIRKAFINRFFSPSLFNRLLLEIRISLKTQELLFVYGHGGTGKTFLWKTIIYALRAEGKIVLAVASSGIASLLLPSGRTAHSRFKLPLDLSDSTLRDILDTPNKLFGGKTVMLGGDFRQTLPVKKGVTRNEIIGSSVAESYLWDSFKLFVLTENTHLIQGNLSMAEKEEVSSFADWPLSVGDGTVGALDELCNTPKIRSQRNGNNGVLHIHAYIWQDLVKETWYGLRDGLGLGPSQRDMAWCSLMRRHG